MAGPEVNVQIVTPIFSYIDNVVDDFVRDNLYIVTNTVSPIVAMGLSCTLIVECLFNIINPNTEHLSSLMKKFLRWSIIISIASTGGIYQKTLVRAAQNIPDEFANVLVLSADRGDTVGLGSMIDTSLAVGIKNAAAAFNNSGAIEGSVARSFQGGAILITTGIICAMGAAFIIMAKVLMSISICLGPIAIYCLLFKSTTGIFNKWMGTIINYGLVTVITAIVFGISEKFFQRTLYESTGIDAILPAQACILMAVVSYIIMKQVPDMAQRLGDGIQASAPGLINSVKGALNPTKGLASSAVSQKSVVGKVGSAAGGSTGATIAKAVTRK